MGHSSNGLILGFTLRFVWPDQRLVVHQVVLSVCGWKKVILPQSTRSSQQKIVESTKEDLLFFTPSIISSTSVFLLPANEVWGKIMFLHLSVILLTCQHAMGQTHTPQIPPGRHPFGRNPPPRQTPPGKHPPTLWILRNTVNKRAVRILLECIHVETNDVAFTWNQFRFFLSNFTCHKVYQFDSLFSFVISIIKDLFFLYHRIELKII